MSLVDLRIDDRPLLTRHPAEVTATAVQPGTPDLPPPEPNLLSGRTGLIFALAALLVAGAAAVVWLRRRR